MALDAAGTPPIALPDDAVPAGYEVVWQAEVLPASLDPVGTPMSAWIVMVGDQSGLCRLQVYTVGPGAVPGDAGVTPGARRGREALIYPQTLHWEEEPGVWIHLSCDTDQETLLRMADSLVLVAPDDPRLLVPPG